jgi:hypothetical protein
MSGPLTSGKFPSYLGFLPCETGHATLIRGFSPKGDSQLSGARRGPAAGTVEPGNGTFSREDFTSFNTSDFFNTIRV